MTSASATVPRTRPRDRKRRIVEAAAIAFAEKGYHAVGMQDIAAAVGISAPALYRHFPNKYALFVHTAFMLIQRVVAATDAAPEGPVDTPRDDLDARLGAAIDVTVEMRATGGIYRWEGRYLERTDRDALTAEFAHVRGTFEAAHRAYRPECPADDRRLLVLAGLSVVASITAHRTAVPARTLRSMLSEAAWRVFDADLPSSAPGVPAPSSSPGPAAGRRERLIDTAIEQFASRGYNEVAIEDLAEAVELTPSGVYRHFDSKSALLLAVYERAAAALEHAVERARADTASPEEALRALVRAHVAHTFSNLPLMRIYFAEIGNLAPEARRRLRALQRAHIGEWVSLLRGVEPALSERDAAVLVHAAFGVVSDQVPLLPVRDALAAARLTRQVEAVLGL